MLLATAHRQAHCRSQRTNVGHRIGQALRSKDRLHAGQRRLAHLHHRTQLFAEQLGQQAVTGGQRQVQAAVAGKRHLAQRGKQATIRSIVIGQQQVRAARFTQRRGKRQQPLWRIEVRRHIAQLAVDLREDGTTQAILATAQIDAQQARGAHITTQFRRERAAHIGQRRERRHDQRHRRHHRLAALRVLPGRLHRQRILSHRNGDAQCRTELLAHRVHGRIQRRVFARLTAGGHPVGRQADVAQRGHVGRQQVGDRFGHGHAGGRRGIEQRHRGALTHRHRLTGVVQEIRNRHGHVADRHLPGAHHLVTADLPADTAVTDRHQEGLVGHGRMRQYAQRRFLQRDAAERQALQHRLHALHLAAHARQLAQQHFDGHVDRVRVELRVVHAQDGVVGELAHHGIDAALALGNGLELRQPDARDDQHVALLRLVAPEFHRRHAGLFVGHLAQVDARAALAVRDRLGHGIGEATGADIMNEMDGVGIAQRPAAVDDLLRAPLHLGVAPLHRGEVQVGARCAAVHRRGRTAAQADEHGRATQDHHVAADRTVVFLNVVAADVAQATGDHDWLVIATHAAARGIFGLLKRPEIARDAGPAKLVVERRRADRALEHDVERADDAIRLAEILLPGLFEARYAQVRH